MKNILVPCDFSAPALNAYRYALRIASKSGGNVHLINAVQPPVLHDTLLMPTLLIEKQLIREVRLKTEEQFRKVISKYFDPNVEVIAKTVVGSLVDAVRSYSKKHYIDLIVMGSQGASGARELLVGSNAEKLVRHSSVPVLVLRDQVKKQSIKDIVFPNSLETSGQNELIDRVKALQNFFKATIHILYVNTPGNFSSDVITLERLRQFVKVYGLRNCTTNIYSHFTEEGGIIEFTNSIDGDMIALGTNKRKGISHLVSGSIAENVVNHTKGLIWTYSLKQKELELY
jgi:nucleotide-binding universal stress UspA family protein